MFRKLGGTIYEVRVSRAVWSRQVGHLRALNIASAKKLIRRALDELFNPDTIAVGTFKLFIAPEDEADKWKGEVHLIVAGPNASELNRVFKKNHSQWGDFVVITEVTDFKSTVRRVIRRKLTAWTAPTGSEPGRVDQTDADLAEYYDWQQELKTDERTIRYGCDRNLNKLVKSARTVPNKFGKKRRRPIWLAPHQFGSHPMTCKCLRCEGPYPLN
jgi:hypothetical protein